MPHCVRAQTVSGGFRCGEYETGRGDVRLCRDQSERNGRKGFARKYPAATISKLKELL